MLNVTCFWPVRLSTVGKKVQLLLFRILVNTNRIGDEACFVVAKNGAGSASEWDFSKKNRRATAMLPKLVCPVLAISSSVPHPLKYHSTNTNSGCTLYLYKLFQAEQIHDFLVIRSVVMEFCLCNRSQSVSQHWKHRTFCFPSKNPRRLSWRAAYKTLMWVGREQISGRSEMPSEDPFSTIVSH